MAAVAEFPAEHSGVVVPTVCFGRRRAGIGDEVVARRDVNGGVFGRDRFFGLVVWLGLVLVIRLGLGLGFLAGDALPVGAEQFESGSLWTLANMSMMSRPQLVCWCILYASAVDMVVGGSWLVVGGWWLVVGIQKCRRTFVRVSRGGRI